MRRNVLLNCLNLAALFVQVQEAISDVVISFRCSSSHLSFTLTSRHLYCNIVFIDCILEFLVEHVKFAEFEMTVENVLENILLGNDTGFAFLKLLLLFWVYVKRHLQIFICKFEVSELLFVFCFVFFSFRLFLFNFFVVIFSDLDVIIFIEDFLFVIFELTYFLLIFLCFLFCFLNLLWNGAILILIFIGWIILSNAFILLACWSGSTFKQIHAALNFDQ